MAIAVDVNANRYNPVKGKGGILSDEKALEIESCVAVKDSDIIADSNDKRNGRQVGSILGRIFFWKIGILANSIYAGDENADVAI